MALSRERFCPCTPAKPYELPSKLFTSPLYTHVHVWMVDGPHVSAEAVLSDTTSGHSHENENKAPGTGALEKST